MAVDRFAPTLKAKLAAGRAKGRTGWDDPEQCSTQFLADLLIHHLLKGNTGTFQDVALFCMMLDQRGADPHELAEQFRAFSAAPEYPAASRAKDVGREF